MNNQNSQQWFQNLLLVIVIVVLLNPIVGPYFGGSETVVPKQSNGEEGTIATIPATAIPTGPASDSIGAVAPDAPPYKTLPEIFPDADAARRYFAEYRPTYTQNFIVTAGAEAIGVGEVSHEPVREVFGITFQTPFDLSKTVAQGVTKVVVQVSTSRDKVIYGMTIVPEGDTVINATVNLDVECITMIAVPVATQSAKTGQTGAYIQTEGGITDKPPRWYTAWLVYYNDYDPYWVGAQLVDQAEAVAAQDALDSIVRSDKLHQTHVASVSTAGANHAYETIYALAHDAICQTLAANGRSCTDVTVNITINPAPAPEHLTWCGTGYEASRVPYATVHEP